MLLLQQNIGQFNVPMYDTFLMNDPDSVTDTKDDFLDGLLWYLWAVVFFQVFLKVAFLAVLEDEVVVVCGFETVMQFDDVRMRDALDQCELLGDHLLLVLGDLVQTDHFDCVFLYVALFCRLKDL